MHAPAARGFAQANAWRGTVSGALLAALLAACGGASEQGATGNDRAEGQSAKHAGRTERAEVGGGTSRSDAFRLLEQATFGPTEADIQRVMEIGPEGWIDEQLALPVRAAHLARWNADNRADPKTGASPATVVSSFYQEAVQDDDQLRQRVTFALSQIFVVSMQDLSLAGSKSQSAASYLDMLAENAFGSYRNLLGAVSMHPAMGQYLSAMANRAENPALGRIPDQNFARELMQLFSIGLVQLNLDGTPKGNAYTYGPSDIDGLSRVFTGFSWAGPDTSKDRFFNNPDAQAKNRLYTPMQPYAQYHSVSEKDFLGVVVPAQQVPDPEASLSTALDTIAAHPNVAPFISRQLIQRLVTSNPSPKYVARVASVFMDDGHGRHGNLGSVVKAILLDKDARQPWATDGQRYGKVREPVLRLTAFLRAFDATSTSGKYLISSTDDPGTQLAQSPLRARSVFNFYRPGYVPTGGPAEPWGLQLPEMQITNESSVAGYVNYMTGAVRYGVGQRGTGTDALCDVQPDYSASMKLADDPEALVDDTIARLLGHTNDPLRRQLIDAVASVEVPALRDDGSNADFVKKQKQNRVYAAVLLTLAAPEFVVQE